MRKLRESWGLQGSLGSADRAAIARWEKELGFSPEMILYAAESAAGAGKPMAYLNRILKEYAEKGIRTKEQIDAERQAHQERRNGKNAPGAAKTVAAQQYAQRDYSGQGENPDDVLERLEEMMKHA